MVVEISDRDFEQEVLQSDRPVIVDFWAEWCGPCRRMAPIVEELAQDYAGRVKVAKVNVDQNAELSGRYGIMSIPTLLFFKGGQVVERLVGLRPKQELARVVESLL
ncbi:MAG: thioredoxin [Moorellales bacterium]